MQLYKSIRILVLNSILFLVSSSLLGQLDTKHWIAPITPSNLSYGEQYHSIYLSTPEVAPFIVYMMDNENNIIQEITISKNSPYTIDVPPLSSLNDPDLIELFNKLTIRTSSIGINYPLEVNIVNDNKGLIFEGEKSFYVSYRVKEENHAAYLSCKGKLALGQEFRIGHFPSYYSATQKYNFFSIMSTESNTDVTFTDFTDGISPFPPNPQQIELNSSFSINLPESGNTYSMMFSTYGDPSKILGSLLSSNKPIIVTCGSWLSSPAIGSSEMDIGIDQIIPANLIGNEYILIRGNGLDALETPIVIANYFNTEIYINGNPVPVDTLNSGEHFIIPSSYYTQQENMYVKSSKPVYMYQSIGGSELIQTGGLSIVPPISCSNESIVDNIPHINEIGNEEFEGGIFIVSKKNSFTNINNGTIPLGTPSEVLGNEDYETYKIQELSGDIVVHSEGPILVGVFGYFENAGWLGYHSGFPLNEEPELQLVNVGGCPDTLIARFNLSGTLSWFKNDTLINSYTDSILVADEEGVFHVVLTMEGSCQEGNLELVSNTIEVSIEPEIEFIEINTTESYCSLSNGILEVIATGGNGQLSYSIDGQMFQNSNVFENLSPGDYTVIIEDENGCLASQSQLLEESDIPIVISIETISSTCGHENGSALFIANGFGGLLEYSLNGTDFQDDNAFNNLSEGNYEIHVRDENQCIVKEEFIITGSLPLNLNSATAISPNCGEENGSLIVDIEGGTGMIQSSLNNSDIQEVYSYNDLGPGEYLLYAVDEIGCDLDTIFYLFSEECPLYIPNAFSPNGDGVNDLFKIFPHPDYKGVFKTFRVFDRWGALQFEANEFNPNDTGWDGRHKEKIVGEGVYPFLIEVQSDNEISKIYKGSVTLVR